MNRTATAMSGLVLSAALTVGCATTQESTRPGLKETELEPAARPKPKAQLFAPRRNANAPFDAKRFVKDIPSPVACEKEARGLRSISDDRAWQALKAKMLELVPTDRPRGRQALVVAFRKKYSGASWKTAERLLMELTADKLVCYRPQRGY